MDKAKENGEHTQAFTISYCAPAQITKTRPHSGVALKTVAKVHPTAAQSSQHTSAGTTTSIQDEPVAVVLWHNGRPYVSTSEEANQQNRPRPRQSRNAHSRRARRATPTHTSLFSATNHEKRSVNQTPKEAASSTRSERGREEPTNNTRH